MKLARFASTTRPPALESAVRQVQTVRQVDAMTGIAGDRERSVRQEMAEIEPQAIADFAGAEQVLAGARQVAAELTRLGGSASGLLQLRALSQCLRRVDDTA